MNDNLSMKLTIPCASEFVGVVRLAISGIASRMNYSIEEIEDIKVSVSEACTNAIQHAYGENTSNSKNNIDIVATIHPEKLEIIVKDTGIGFDTNILGTHEQKSRSEERLGLGLGLSFVKSLMDDATFNSEIGKGTTIIMSKKAPKITTEE